MLIKAQIVHIERPITFRDTNITVFPNFLHSFRMELKLLTEEYNASTAAKTLNRFPFHRQHKNRL